MLTVHNNVIHTDELRTTPEPKQPSFMNFNADILLMASGSGLEMASKNLGF